MAGGGGGGQGAEELREGQLLLGAPTFEDMENGRVRCVETGHELPSRDMAESYGRSKGCRLALIDAAIARKKPPLNMFKPDPFSKSKLICKLTGDTINKSEEHIWKHITGKRFQNKLNQKEAALDTETPESNGVAGKKANRDKKKVGEVAADGDLDENANQLDKASCAKKTIIKNNYAENISKNGSMSSKVATGRSDSEEPDFWVPPIGSRWDYDDGKDRWEACSNSSPEKDEDVCKGPSDLRPSSGGGMIEPTGRDFTTAATPYVTVSDAQDEAGTRDLSARTKRMPIAVGPSSFASRKKKSKKGSAD